MLFKNQYYYFIAGLPDFTFDSMKLPFTVGQFSEMLSEELKRKDYELLKKYFLSFDNENLIKLLNDKEAQLHPMGTLSREELLETIELLREDVEVKSKTVPQYYLTFIRKWLGEESHEQTRVWEDLLTSLYTEYGLEVKNTLMSRWFEMNMDVNNILSAIYAKKHGLEVSKAVVGNNVVARTIRENSNLRDFGLSLEFENFEMIQRISDEDDIYERERKIDKYRWDWLEENTVFDYFNIEYIFAYLCKLQILERWVSLNAEEGERIFRALIDSLKNEVDVPKE